MPDEKPKGQLFTHVYLERGTPQQDSATFRRRIGHYCAEAFSEWSQSRALAMYLVREMGLEVPALGNSYDLERFLINVDIRFFLNAITLIWRFAKWNKLTTVMGGTFGSLSEVWLAFVRRVMSEENIGYSVDDAGGIHFLVDEEFERNRVSVLSSLGNQKYAGVRLAFEDAHRHLDNNPPDTKASVRSMFESIEILIRKMVPEAKNLSSHVIDNKLKPLVLPIYSADEIAQKTIEQILDGFSKWVDGLHNYRHGQGKDEPVKPPLDFSIFVLSSGAAYLRWLVEIESKLNPA